MRSEDHQQHEPEPDEREPDRADVGGFDRVAEPSRVDRLDAGVGQLRDDELIVLDEVVEDADTLQICDRVNLERLLRMARSQGRPAIEPLPARALPHAAGPHGSVPPARAD